MHPKDKLDHEVFNQHPAKQNDRPTPSASDSVPLLSPSTHSTSATTVNEDFDDEYWNERDEAFFASADLTTPQPTPPFAVVLSRWFKQPPSASLKVAYVLFTTSGEPEGLGVYYNWTACSKSIIEGGGKDVCSFRGYPNYELAHAAWLGFQQTGILPLGISTLSPSTSRGWHGDNILQHSRPHTPHTPQRSSRGATSRQASPALSPAWSPTVEQAHDFWVVLSGYEPGVYQTYSSAQHAMGISKQNLLPANSRQSANQIFVDAYMAHRVDRDS